MDPTPGNESPPGRHRWAIDFSVHGDLRYLSHRDMMRLFARALARAELPVLFSRGFNPRPKLSLPMPRPVGIASDAECLLLELKEAVSDQELLRRLREQMPQDLTIRRVSSVPANVRFSPSRVTYRIRGEGWETPTLAERTSRLLQESSYFVNRLEMENKTTKRVDIRPYIDSLQLTGEELTMCLVVTGSGTARPAEVGEALGLPLEGINARICRTEIQWL